MLFQSTNLKFAHIFGVQLTLQTNKNILFSLSYMREFENARIAQFLMREFQMREIKHARIIDPREFKTE